MISQEWSFRKKKSKKRLTKTKKKKPKLIATSFQTTCQLNNTFFPFKGKKIKEKFSSWHQADELRRDMDEIELHQSGD